MDKFYFPNSPFFMAVSAIFVVWNWHTCFTFAAKFEKVAYFLYHFAKEKVKDRWKGKVRKLPLNLLSEDNILTSVFIFFSSFSFLSLPFDVLEIWEEAELGKYLGLLPPFLPLEGVQYFRGQGNSASSWRDRM